MIERDETQPHRQDAVNFGMRWQIVVDALNRLTKPAAVWYGLQRT